MDDDCNGWVDDDVPGWNADRVYPGKFSNDYAGWAITMGDLDDDGDQDLIVGSYGAGGGPGGVAVFDGGSPKPDGTDVTAAHEWIPGSGSSDQFGYSVAYMSSTGVFPEPYLAVGAPNAAFGYGMVYLLLGDDARAGGTTSSAVFTISGSGGSGGHYVGRGLSQDIDLDGDGTIDLLGTYRTSTTTSNRTPSVYLFYGDNWDSGAVSNVLVNDADARFSISRNNTAGGLEPKTEWNMPSAGDGNGDGYTDFMFDAGPTSTTTTTARSTWCGATRPASRTRQPTPSPTTATRWPHRANTKKVWRCANGLATSMETAPTSSLGT